MLKYRCDCVMTTYVHVGRDILMLDSKMCDVVCCHATDRLVITNTFQHMTPESLD